MPAQVHFDDYAENYDAALNQGLSATGDEKDYFARGRIQWLAQLDDIPRRIMDYGCGDGSSSGLLLSLIKPELVIGVDTSEKSLQLATQKFGTENCSFFPIAEYSPNKRLDLVYCNGVFHHIPPKERTAALNYIWRSL